MEEKVTTWADFAPHEWVFDVENPGGQKLTIKMRDLTPAELLAVEMAHPRPEPRQIGFTGTASDGNLKAQYESDKDAPAKNRQQWAEKLTKWMHELRMRQVLKAMLEPEIPGEDDVEKLKALMESPSWAQNAFNWCIGRITSTPDDALRVRSFR
jgi:hypothetical protein